MKRTLIAATIAALTVPVALAAPAHASNDVHIRVDPRDWTFSGTVWVARTVCGARGCVESAASIQNFSFNVGPGVPMQDVLDWTWDPTNTYRVDLVATLSSGDMTWYPFPVSLQISDPLFGEMTVAATGTTPGKVNIQYDFGKPGGEYELKFYPDTWVAEAQPQWDALMQSLTNSVSVTVSDDAAGVAERSKNTEYVTDQPRRITAMAKRLVAAPGDLINIHGYGPDRDVALARAEHVRAHLKSEIARLGGDPDAYPVIVVYAGDPAHKKGVHVTIHQHTAPASPVVEGGALTIGGTS